MMKSYLKRRKKGFFTPLASFRAGPAGPAGSLTPPQVCKAYQFAKVKQARPVVIGILSLGGFYSDSDTTTAFQGYGQPKPNVKAQGTQDATDTDSTVENMLDIECAGSAFAYATGNAASIIEDFQPNSGTGIPDSINALVAAGCEVISCSWGGPLSGMPASELQATAQAILNAQNQGVHFFAASGDNSLNDGTNARTPDSPSCDANAWAVGGTTLTLNADGSIASEAAWGDGNAADEGGGGGFVPGSTQPVWQKGVVPGSLLGKPDSSANADPASGYQIVANGQWQVVGGTSASTPLTAGYVAALLSSLPGRISGGQLQTLLYGNAKTAFRDVVLGSNGDPATAGWDDATGIGSPNGPGMLVALSGGTVVAPPVGPPVTPPVTAGPTEAQVQGAVDALFVGRRIVTKTAIDQAIQGEFRKPHASEEHVIDLSQFRRSAFRANAMPSVNFSAIIAEIVALVGKHGQFAVPLVEQFIANSSLTAAQKAMIDAVLETLLGKAA